MPVTGVSPDITWDARPEDCESLLAQCHGATFFHTPRWLEAMARVFGGEPRVVLAQWSDRDWAIWPLTVKPLAKGRLPHAVSGETGAYGGALAPRSVSTERAWKLYSAVAERWQNVSVTGNPALDAAWFPPPRGARLDFTHVVGPAAASPNRGWRAHVNRATREGYEVAIRRGGDAGRFLALYEEAVARWGERLTWRRPETFFRALVHVPGIWTFTARLGSVDAAMAVCAEWGSTVYYLAGATGAAHLQSGASNLLIAAVADWARQNGHRTLDLGPSQGLEGVIRFKESFGARPVAFYRWEVRTSAGRLYDRARTLFAPLVTK